MTMWGTQIRKTSRKTSRKTWEGAIGVLLGSIGLAASLSACTPKVALEAPAEPIVINMNIKIEHELRVKVDDDLEALFEDEEEIF